MLNIMYHHHQQHWPTIKEELPLPPRPSPRPASSSAAAAAAALTAPDIILVVGNLDNTVSFLAHRLVLSAHSGYFKTLFSNYKGSEVHVSNMSAQTFALLLKFVYTGRLELNSSNIYEIFLASNILHITDALNLCRQYLTKHNYTKPILKPIPRKKSITVNALKSIETLKYQPLRASNDRSASIFKPVGNAAAAAAVAAATAAAVKRSAATVAVATDLTITKVIKFAPKSSSTATSGANVAAANSITAAELDIAYCDGPIKFRKVVNRFYNPSKANVLLEQNHNTISDGTVAAAAAAYTNENDDMNVAAVAAAATIAPDTTIVPCHGCKHVLKSYHHHHRHHLHHHQRRIIKSDNDTDQDDSPNQHQQHPTVIRIASSSSSSVSSSSQSAAVEAAIKYKKKQYAHLQCYTCKICGSKFPSYYFVHKHRKLHHSSISNHDITETITIDEDD